MRGQVATHGIVLSRLDYQEADRILTVLTPDHGKVRVIAKGARRSRSKLAAGIELFSINEMTLLFGASAIRTLVSSRLQHHYGGIVSDLDRTMYGYEILRHIHKTTEDEAGDEYFSVLQSVFEGLNHGGVLLEYVKLWTTMQLLIVSGQTPNIRTDSDNQPLDPTKTYAFDFEAMAFRVQEGGPYNAGHIKLLRVAYVAESPVVLAPIRQAAATAEQCFQLLQNFARMHA